MQNSMDRNGITLEAFEPVFDEEHRRALQARCDGLFEDCVHWVNGIQRIKEYRERALDLWTYDYKVAVDGKKIYLSRVDERGREWYRPVPVRTQQEQREIAHMSFVNMMRRLDNPAGRLLLKVRAAERLVLPSLRAENADQRDRINALLGDVLGLSEAVEEGLLKDFVVFWQKTGRWPRRPMSVRLHWPGGKAESDRLLGEHGKAVNGMLRSMEVRLKRQDQ